MQSARSLFVCALIAAGLVLAIPTTARAQYTDVSPTGKGIVGGALLGAEAVTLTEAVFSVKSTWAYVIGGSAGAVAGGVGGHFLEQGATTKTSMLVLGGGMLLIIPTTVAILSATAYEPPVDYTQDQGPTDKPLAEPPAPDAGPNAGSSRSTSTRARGGNHNVVRRDPPLPSLVGLNQGTLSLGVPAVALSPVFSAEERFKYGVKQQTGLRVPVVHMRF
jgi:hypothetical protein